MITKEQQAALSANLPAEWVTQRQQAGETLDYIEGWAVIGELNRIFGPGCWSYSTEAHEAARVEHDGKWAVTYTARCVLSVGDCTIADYGAASASSKRLGDAIEMAIKSAATDSLKRCAKSLGPRLGLALYDKQKRQVGEPEPQDGPGAGADVVLPLLEQIGRIASRDEWVKAQNAVNAVWLNMNDQERQSVNAAFAAAKARGKKVA